MVRAVGGYGIVLVAALTAGAADWPTLRGNVQRDGYVEVPISGPFSVAWVRHFAKERISTAVEPIVAAGRLFVGTHDGYLYALDAETGEALWRFQAHAAFLHSPAHSDGLLVAGCADGYVYGLDAASGRLRWRSARASGGFAASPAIDAGLIVIGSRRGQLLALEGATGDVRWQHQLDAPIRQTAAIAHGRVYVMPEDLRLRCYDLFRGELLWTSPQLYGQTARDYYPVVINVGNTGYVWVCTNPMRNMAEHIGRDRRLLCQNVGIPEGWQRIEAWIRSAESRGDADAWHREQQAIAQHLQRYPDAQTGYCLEAATGNILPKITVLWSAGCQGVGAVPARLPDGRAAVLYRSAYGNWSLGVAPLVALGACELPTGKITPWFHRHGTQPPWNTFWGTADESQHLVVTPDVLLIVHQGTLSGFRWKTGELFTICGERDSWAGFRNLPWARNEWHGPARGGVAIVERNGKTRMYWQSGSRIVCVVAGERSPMRVDDIGIDGARVPTQRAPALPPIERKSLQQRLHAAVDELLDDRWAPLCVEPGLAGRQFAYTHSGDVFEALAWAYPHLADDLRERVRNYLERQWTAFPPFSTQGSYPLDEGRAREWRPMLEELRQPGPAQPSPHPFAYVGTIARYAQRCEAEEVVQADWPRIRQTYHDFVRTSWQLDPQRGDSFAHRYLDALEAYRQLALRFGDAESAEAAKQHLDKVRETVRQWWRSTAANVQMPIFRDIREWDRFLGQGDALFLCIRPHCSQVAVLQGITPTVAELLRREEPAAVEHIWSVFLQLCPTWYLVGEERQVHYGENYVDAPQFSTEVFAAYTWLQDASAHELAERVDVPLGRADVGYIRRLAMALDRIQLSQPAVP